MSVVSDASKKSIGSSIDDDSFPRTQSSKGQTETNKTTEIDVESQGLTITTLTNDLTTTSILKSFMVIFLGVICVAGLVIVLAVATTSLKSGAGDNQSSITRTKEMKAQKTDTTSKVPGVAVSESTTAFALHLPPGQKPSTPSAHCNILEAAFRIPENGDTYFLSKGEYISYSFEMSSEIEVKSFAELKISSDMESPSAAFVLKDRKLVVIKGSQYTIHEKSQTPEKETFRQISSGKNFPFTPDAAVSMDGEILVFQGCDIFKLESPPQVEDDPWNLQKTGRLPDLGLPCDLDSALELEGEYTLFFKGAQNWVHFSGETKGPIHIDKFGICSWYICGEADWMEQKPTEPAIVNCNGDSRLCPLRLNQVTLPGLHNAGSGFAGPYEPEQVDCIARNHARNITDQMERGIRHLDIDPSFEICGVVGSQHTILCGGAICPIIKQIRHFLAKHPHDVVTVNFNHEMQDKQIVIPALTRQLKRQLGPLLNSHYRSGKKEVWPTLHEAVNTNQRVFVFFPPDVDELEYNHVYNGNPWIHTEDWLLSTWEEFKVEDDCSQIVENIREMCRYRYEGTGYKNQLMDVSILPAPKDQYVGPCIKKLAALCKPWIKLATQSCEAFSYKKGSSPNLILVDYPEDGPEEETSVFNAVFQQNMRNLLAHRPDECHVKINAAVQQKGSKNSFFFVGTKIITYNHDEKAQIDQRIDPDSNYDSAILLPNGDIMVTKDCKSRLLSGSTAKPKAGDGDWTTMTSCDKAIDASFVMASETFRFVGCKAFVFVGDETIASRSLDLIDMSLPCDVDAALVFEGDIFVFKGNEIGKRAKENTEMVFSSKGEKILDNWPIDVVHCV